MEMEILNIMREMKCIDRAVSRKIATKEEAEKVLATQKWYGISATFGLCLTSELSEEFNGKNRLWWYDETYYDGEEFRSVKLLWLKLCWNQDTFDRQFWKEVITEKSWPVTRRQRGFERIASFYTTFTEQAIKEQGYNDPFTSPTTHSFAHLSHAINHALMGHGKNQTTGKTSNGLCAFSDLADMLLES